MRESVNVYYFSGTGNSLYVAKRIAEQSKGRLLPIAAIEREEIADDADVIGIVFPVYYIGLPNIVRRFAGKLRNIESKYIFAVATYGGGKGVAIKDLNSLIKANKGRISAVYGIHMPQSSFRKPLENHVKLYSKANKMADRICRNIDLKKKGAFYSNIIVDVGQRALNPFLKSLCVKGLMKISGSSSRRSREELICLADNSLRTNDKCNGCGICVEVCPSNNIHIIDDAPVWQNRCETCSACYNYCPKHAIETEFIQRNYYYRHPEISLEEMIAQKGEFKE